MHIAPAVFAGWEPNPNPFKSPIAFYTMLRDAREFKRGQIVSAQALKRAGYWAPMPTWRYRPERAS